MVQTDFRIVEGDSTNLIKKEWRYEYEKPDEL